MESYINDSYDAEIKPNTKIKLEPVDPLSPQQYECFVKQEYLIPDAQIKAEPELSIEDEDYGFEQQSCYPNPCADSSRVQQTFLSLLNYFKIKPCTVSLIKLKLPPGQQSVELVSDLEKELKISTKAPEFPVRSPAILQERNPGRICCTDCGLNESELRRRGVECRLCLNCFGDHNYFKLHRPSILSEGVVRCSICGNCLKYICSIRNYEESKLKDTSMFRCDLCGAGYAKPESLMEHKAAHLEHRRKIIFKCKLCDKRFESKWSLTVHKMAHEENVHNCPYCTSRFVTLQGRNEHVRTHFCENSISCEICNRVFVSQKRLKEHKYTHVDGNRTRFKCNLCGAAYSRMYALKDHKAIHTGIKPFQCDVCFTFFFTEKRLRSHYKIHTRGAKEFRCEQCGSKFRTSSGLRNHKTVHSGAKAFQCNLCGSSFFKKLSLREHKKIHSKSSKSFCCDVCLLSFPSRTALSMHFEEDHGNQFDCSLCEKSFKTLALRDRHLQTRH